MGLAAYLASQARRPEGLFGQHVAGRVFDKANKRLNDHMVASLELQPYQKVLEIGFGRGRLLKKIAGMENGLELYGVDFSSEMVELAKKYNKELIRESKVFVEHADLQDMPYDDEYFDSVFTGNTIYFWPEPNDNILEIKRVLKKGGKLVIGFRTRSQMVNIPITRHGFRLYEEEDILNLMRRAGFKDLRASVKKESRGFDSYCAIGEK